jgi:hypothetical protein
MTRHTLDSSTHWKKICVAVTLDGADESVQAGRTGEVDSAPAPAQFSFACALLPRLDRAPPPARHARVHSTAEHAAGPAGRSATMTA